jgi:N-methylhydantoinase B
MEVSHRHGGGFGIHATFERVVYPARGREGGGNGANGRLSLASAGR